MNRGRKGGGGNRVDEDIPDELRCKRSDGKQWRCNARAMDNKTLCEKHYNQAKKRAAGANTNSSPKKKTKKEVASPEPLQLNRPALDMRNKVPSRGTVERPSKPYSSGSVPGGDYRLGSDHRHANYKHGDYRSTSDYRHTSDYKTLKDPSNSRQRFINGSSMKLEDTRRPRRSPGRDSFFKDEPVHFDEEIEQQNETCHQCQKNDRGELLRCLQCRRKSYCSQCISRWYSTLHEDDFRQSCAHCRGICNCKACVMLDGGVSIFSEVKVVNDLDKVKFLRYMLSFIQPLLEELHDEQTEEIDLEVSLTGDESLKAERSKLMKDERLYCDNCNTSIVDLYRSCLSCGYDMCLACCRELRQCQQPGGELANSADQPSIARLKGSSRWTESKLPIWHSNADSSIPCPPSERGGCGTTTLVLKRILKSNWIAKLATEVNALVPLDQKPPLGVDAWCSCTVDSEATSFECFDKDVRQASCRSDRKDNYIYSPTSQAAEREGLEHFQKHWLQGEPVIVRGILNETQGLNWEPLVLWRALRDSTSGKSMAVRDCLDWCLVEISINQFFKGYQEGRVRKTGWPELLKMREPLSASIVEERLPRLGVQLIRDLPFHEYTNVRHGVLNLASKIPDDCLRPDYGPKATVSYGLREEIGRGDSVTKLHYDMSDTVMVLAHSTEVKLRAWQTARLDKFRAEYKKLAATEPARSGDQGASCFSSALHDERNFSVSSNGLRKEVYHQGMISAGNEEAVKIGQKDFVHGSDDSQTFMKQEISGEKLVENEKEITKPSLVQLCEMKESESYGGVLWDVFRRQDVPMLQAYLLKHCKEFRHTNEEIVEQVAHPLYDQTFYLSREHKRRLKDEFGIEPWTFEQHVGEAILIPAGCPYQTKNLKSCVSITLEFVSPENIKELIHLSEQFRLLPKGHPAKDDKLEVQKLMLYAANRAVKDIRHLTSTGSEDF